jgi:hypothetical protein
MPGAQNGSSGYRTVRSRTRAPPSRHPAHEGEETNVRRTHALRSAIAAITSISIVLGALLLGLAPSATAATPSLTDTTLTNPQVSGAVGVLTHGRLAERNGVSAFLYYQSWGSRPWASFREASTGTISNVSLSSTSVAINEWQDASVVLTAEGHLLVMSGTGPVFVREFQLSGSPLPTSATLVGTWTFGDADSRPGDMIQMASGAVSLVWHQQGDTGPQGYGIAYRAAAGSSWAQTYPVQFMPSWASKQVVVQHPADGSLWIFSSPDAWGRIGAMHLTEGASGLTLDWTNGSYLAPEMGAAAPDPENPWLAVAADPATGTIALAYQSADRRTFSTSPVVTGSKPAITRIGTSAVATTVVLPVYVERVSSMALSVRGASTWLAYRPIDEATLTFSDLYVSLHDGSTWQPAARLGTLAGSFERVSYATSAPELVARMADGQFHYFAEQPTSPTTTSTTLATTTTSSTTTTTAPAPTTVSSKSCKGRKCP